MELKKAHERYAKQFNECKMFYKKELKDLKTDSTEKNSTLKSFKTLLEKNLGEGFLTVWRRPQSHFNGDSILNSMNSDIFDILKV